MSGTSPSGSTGTSDRSLGQIVGDVTQDLSALVRQELQLAKTEAKQEASRAGRGAGLLTGAGVAGHLLLVFVSLALMFFLENWMPIEIATLITAAIWLLVALILASAGRKALARVNPALPQTQRSLKEDAEWARQQKS